MSAKEELIKDLKEAIIWIDSMILSQPYHSSTEHFLKLRDKYTKQMEELENEKQ